MCTKCDQGEFYCAVCDDPLTSVEISAGIPVCVDCAETERPLTPDARPIRTVELPPADVS